MARRIRPLLGFVPKNLSLFHQAFYHKSTANAEGKLSDNYHNERLEYLGDALLNTIVAEYLYKKYPNGSEGFLTKMRAKIVKRKTLNYIGDQMGLDLLLTEYNSMPISKSMLGNALEALVGAVYLERGYGATRIYVVQRILMTYLDIHHLENSDENYKSLLLEWCQKNGKDVNYELIERYKFEKRDRFRVAVNINGERIAEADAFNKKSAEQNASAQAIVALDIQNS